MLTNRRTQLGTHLLVSANNDEAALTEQGFTVLELKKAADSLKISLDLYSNNSKNVATDVLLVYRDACIQRFEYCIELSWKISMKSLGLNTKAAKPAIREMARNDLISNPELWLAFIEARNNSSHAYDEDIAQKVFKQIELFFVEVTSLLQKLEKQS